jgi:hypothetical protein
MPHTFVDDQTGASTVGFVVTSTDPEPASTAAHIDVEAHEFAKSPPLALIRHVGFTAVGLVVIAAFEPSAATQSDVDGQETLFRPDGSTV